MDDLVNEWRDWASGHELIAKGFPRNLKIAAEIDQSRSVPMLRDHAFVPAP